MIVILMPKALPGEVLKKITANEEEQKINAEVDRRTQAVVQEDVEVTVLGKQLRRRKKDTKRSCLTWKPDCGSRVLLARSYMRKRRSREICRFITSPTHRRYGTGRIVIKVGFRHRTKRTSRGGMEITLRMTVGNTPFRILKRRGLKIPMYAANIPSLQ